MSLSKKLKFSEAELIVADSEKDANLYYATRFLVPDPVPFLRIGNKKYLILNDLEVDRGKAQAQVDEVISLSALKKSFQKKKDKPATLSDLLHFFLKKHAVKKLTLPRDFPASLAFELKKKDFKITFRPDPFFEDRLYKTAEEKEAIRYTLKQTGLAIQMAYEVLKKSKIQKNGQLLDSKELLTSESLRRKIELFLMQRDCLAEHTIVAGGEQGVDPHNRGSGPLNAHQTIIMDVFPRSLQSRYFADMTRTVVKGKPSTEISKLWKTVKEAQERAIDQIREGIDGKTVHEGILQLFQNKGYKTGLMNGRMQGFFHGTGHGLGLDIHEAPRVSAVSSILKEGMVVTVEPGLYYQGIGGVRIEDVVYVTKDGCEVLSECPKILSVEE